MPDLETFSHFVWSNTIRLQRIYIGEVCVVILCSFEVILGDLVIQCMGLTMTLVDFLRETKYTSFT